MIWVTVNSLAVLHQLKHLPIGRPGAPRRDLRDPRDMPPAELPDLRDPARP